MKQEDKELLLKDLCSRLPYDVKCDVGYNKPYTLCRIEIDSNNEHLLDFIETIDEFDVQYYLCEVKPYLFPLSSMTDKLKEEHKDLVENQYHFDANGNMFTLQDFYCKYHLDYRGLIPMGLAFDATGLNIY